MGKHERPSSKPLVTNGLAGRRYMVSIRPYQPNTELSLRVCIGFWKFCMWLSLLMPFTIMSYYIMAIQLL